MKGFLIGFSLATILLVGGFFIFRDRPQQAKEQKQEISVQKYYCPMHPMVISDHPGDCPICGMKLVPMKSDKADVVETDADAEKIQVPEGYAPLKIPADKLQVMGVTYTDVKEMELQQSIRTVGRVEPDERRIHHIHTKFEGYIENIYVDYTGQFVRKGQPLFSVYSPELVATQREFVLSLKARDDLKQSGGNLPGVDLVSSARRRLEYWDIGPSQIAELEKTRQPLKTLVIRSPVSGFVTEKTAIHGTKVTPADNLYQIVDLSRIWVMADLYEMNLPYVKVGTPARITMPDSSSESWNGKVTYIDQVMDPETRTAKARIEIANPSNRFKPEMFLHVTFEGTVVKGIAVPDGAVISTGERSIVFVAKGGGEFEPREVETGVKVRGYYEIRKGISVGERVVTSGNFLLDSESKLQAAISTDAGQHSH